MNVQLTNKMTLYKRIVKRLLHSSGLATLNEVKEQSAQLHTWGTKVWPPGHYYSPIPSKEEIPDKLSINYDATIAGIDLNEDFQRSLLDRLKAFYKEDLFPYTKQDGCRYYFDNDYFGYSDAIFLSSMMKEYKPKKIIEVGSGFSSAVMIETNEKFFGGKINLEFIEPYPEERLSKLISKEDNCTVIKDFIQNIQHSVWDTLEENDILFIDTSHVSKFNSDVNHLIFEVLPRLRPGVIIHFHDIFFPFEYPLEWLKIGRAWNEAYILRAFLQYNTQFEILLFTSHMEGKYREWFQKHMPLCLKTHKVIEVDNKISVIQTTGQSIYLRKLA